MANGDGLPGDPMTAAQMGAAQQHEMFLAWMAAGFSDVQALELLKAAVAALVLKP